MSVCVKNLSFSYGNKPILQDISFTANSGEVLSILGANGVGKSTLFRCILGFMPKYAGEIIVDGVSLGTLSIKQVAQKIAYVPQSHYTAFHYTVFDMVLMGTTAQLSIVSSPDVKQYQQVREAMEAVGITHLAEQYYPTLSGGEKQLTLIARALVQQGKILMLDEPTSNMDYGNQLQVMQKIGNLAKQGYTVIQITHSPEQSFLFSDKILALKSGRILAHGTPKEVITTGLMDALYGVKVSVQSLLEDKLRVCVPMYLTEEMIE